MPGIQFPQLTQQHNNNGLKNMSQMLEGLPDLRELISDTVREETSIFVDGPPVLNYSAVGLKEIFMFGGTVGTVANLMGRYSEGATQFGKRREIIPRIPLLDRLPRLIENAIADLTPVDVRPLDQASLFLGFQGLESILPAPRRELAQAMLDVAPRWEASPLIVTAALTHALEQVRGLDSIFGSFHIWKKSPRRETCRRIIAALQSGDVDSEDFLNWFCEQELGLRRHADAEFLTGQSFFRSAYVARALLGVRKQQNGDIVAPGDITIVNKRRNIDLASKGEEQIYDALRDAALRSSDYEAGNFVKQVTVTRGTEEIEQGENLWEISELLNTVTEIIDHSTLRAATLDAVKADIWKTIGLAAGLTGSQATFLAKLKTGRAVARDNRAAYEAIRRKHDVIECEQARFIREKLPNLEHVGGAGSAVGSTVLNGDHTYPDYHRISMNKSLDRGPVRIGSAQSRTRSVDCVVTSSPATSSRACSLAAYSRADRFPPRRFNPDHISTPQFRTEMEFRAANPDSVLSSARSISLPFDPRAAARLIHRIERARQTHFKDHQ